MYYECLYSDLSNFRNDKIQSLLSDSPLCLLSRFQDNSNLYMVLEFISGGEMFSHLRRLGKFRYNQYHAVEEADQKTALFKVYHAS